MFDSFLPLRFPLATRATLLAMGACLVLAFLVAVLMELLRKRSARRRQTQAEWDAVKLSIQKKEFSKQEEELLIRILRRRAPDTPLQILSTRREFDACVETEMDAVRAAGDEDQFRETGIMLREIRVRLDLDYVPFGQRIQSTRALNVGQEVWLAPAKPGAGQWSRASVMAVDEAYLHVNVRDEKLTGDAPGRELRCHFWREDDARYELTLTVARSEGAPPTISFLHANNLRRVQARDYFRVRCNQETTIGVLSAVSGQEDGQPRRVVTRVRGRISSLSGGGLAVVTQHVLQVARLLRVSIELPNERPFEADITTVAVDPIAGGRYLVRGAFVDIPDEKRDAIAHYVMRRQQPQPLAHDDGSPAHGVERAE